MRSGVVCLLVLALAGCSSPARAPGDGASGRAGPGYDEAVVRDGLADLFAGRDPRPRDVAEGECIAGELLAATAPGELRAGGLLDDEGRVVSRLPILPDGLAGTTADAQLACVDVVAASTRALTSVRKGDLDPAAYAECLGSAVPRDSQRDALAATLAGRYDDPAVARLAEAQVDCAEQHGRGDRDG